MESSQNTKNEICFGIPSKGKLGNLYVIGGNSFIHSVTQLFIHSFIHSLIYTFFHSVILFKAFTVFHPATWVLGL